MTLGSEFCNEAEYRGELHCWRSSKIRGKRNKIWVIELVLAVPNLKEDWVIDGDAVKKAAVEADDDTVIVEVSTEPLPEVESVAEANMGQR